jgi:uncharacterized protein YlxP (DUF503 family)
MKAFIAHGIVHLRLPWAHSLKEKRAVLRSLCDQFRHRHKTQLVRLHGVEAHQWEILGFVVMGAEHAQVQATANKMSQTIEAAEGEFQISGSRVLIDEVDLDELARFLPG